jgi:malate dehydrogenase (oxaloacetate-decarboxylating)(NADP+)
MSVRREDALAYHSEGRPGKISIAPTKPFKAQRELSLAYSPGVAEPCKEIAAHPEDAYKYTAKGNLVAVVSNGTAVLGMGNIGPLASKPVMEGKGVLFKTFADIDVFDLEVGSEDPQDIIRFCQLLEPTVGGINLEDIRAPDCFLIEERLRETLSIPVFHDDQHGTAIISGAALLNALEVVDKDIAKVRVVFSGAGAAAIATAEHYVALGASRENIVMVDSKGVLHHERDLVDPYRSKFIRQTDARTLADAMKDADVFVGLSVAGVVDRAMIRSMADRPIVFALANPDPEILPEEVREARADAIVATGRSDYPNQVNNVLGFPFIFRGALDARAVAINEPMKMAATRALAELTKEDVPDAVKRAYGLDLLRFGSDYIIPTPFDDRALLWVAPAVAKAAEESGVAGTHLDHDAYIHALEARLGPARAIMRGLTARAASKAQRIVFPEGEDARILRAARIMVDERTAVPTVLGNRTRIEQESSRLGLDLEGIEIVDPEESPLIETYARALWERRQRKGITLAEARRRVRLPMYHGCMMLEAGDADAVVGGEEAYYPDAIRPALETIGTATASKALCSIYMMILPNATYFFADCAVNIDPDADRLADIAAAAASFVWKLGIEPRVAMLSFSNFGSVRHPHSEKVASATAILHKRLPSLTVDGEMQVDVAVVEEQLTNRYPFSKLTTPANVLIFPDLNSANIGYKLLIRLGKAQAIGPILVGMRKTVHVLQRGSDVNDIVNISVIAAVDAQERARNHEPH